MYISQKEFILVDPDSHIFPCNQKSSKIINLRYLLFVTSNSLLPRCMLDCIHSQKYINWLLLCLLGEISSELLSSCLSAIILPKVPE